MSTDLTASFLQNVSVRVLQVMLEVFFRKLPDVLARILAEDSERVGGHGGNCIQFDLCLLREG